MEHFEGGNAPSVPFLGTVGALWWALLVEEVRGTVFLEGLDVFLPHFLHLLGKFPGIAPLVGSVLLDKLAAPALAGFQFKHPGKEIVPFTSATYVCVNDVGEVDPSVIDTVDWYLCKIHAYALLVQKWRILGSCNASRSELVFCRNPGICSIGASALERCGCHIRGAIDLERNGCSSPEANACSFKVTG